VDLQVRDERKEIKDCFKQIFMSLERCFRKNFLFVLKNYG